MKKGGRPLVLKSHERTLDLARAEYWRRKGTLYLTSQRVVWLADEYQLPPTAWTGDLDVVLPLKSVQAVARRSHLIVHSKRSVFEFRLLQGRCLPIRSSATLARRWARAINAERTSMEGVTTHE